jgi:hypothetical protein
MRIYAALLPLLFLLVACGSAPESSIAILSADPAAHDGEYLSVEGSVWRLIDTTTSEETCKVASITVNKVPVPIYGEKQAAEYRYLIVNKAGQGIVVVENLGGRTYKFTGTWTYGDPSFLDLN